MKKGVSPRMFLFWIVGGALVGSVMGALMWFGAFGDRESTDRMMNVMLAGCIGLIVLLIDMVCIWAVLRPLLLRHIAENGRTVTGIIKDLRVIPLPADLNADEWIQRAHFAATIVYDTEKGRMTVEFPPTCLTSRRDIYPLIMTEGAEIPVGYLPKHPKIAVIADERLQTGQAAEQRRNRPYVIGIPAILTAIYVIMLIRHGT